LISQGVHPLGRVKQGWDVDNKITNYFRAKCVDISQAVGDTSKLLLMNNGKMNIRRDYCNSLFFGISEGLMNRGCSRFWTPPPVWWLVLDVQAT